MRTSQPSASMMPKLSTKDLNGLKRSLTSTKKFLEQSKSPFADGRKELSIRRKVSLDGEIKYIPQSQAGLYYSDYLEEIGDRLMPAFHHALLLYYPAGCGILPHTDADVYQRGAICLNIEGGAAFSISIQKDINNMAPFYLEEGDCIQFDNKEFHSVDPVKSDRWCICFFNLHPLVEAEKAILKDLNAGVKIPASKEYKRGDSVAVYHPRDQTWRKSVFCNPYTPEPGSSRAKDQFSFLELIDSKSKVPVRAYGFDQIRHLDNTRQPMGKN